MLIKRFFNSRASVVPSVGIVNINNSSANVVLLLTSSSSSSVRHQSSILGTNTLSPEFLEQFREDVMDQELLAQQERQVGGIYASCIRKGELDHMESPEADKKHLKKLESAVDTLFASIPEPKDPMKAARAPTRDELEDREQFETLKEAMRDRYRNQQNKKKSENARIDAAMKAVEDGTYDEKYAQSRDPSVRPESASMTAEQVEKITMMQELAEAKKKMKEMQEQLEALQKSQQQKK